MRTEPSAELASRFRSRQNAAIVVLRQVLSAYESGRQCRARRREHFVAVLLRSVGLAFPEDLDPAKGVRLFAILQVEDIVVEAFRKRPGLTVANDVGLVAPLQTLDG
jgi:hypothetical protein